MTPIRYLRNTILEIVPRVRQVERLVDQRKVRNDIADHRVLEYWPVLPRRIVRMAATDGIVGPALERDQHRSAPTLDATQREHEGVHACDRGGDLSFGQRFENGIDEAQGLESLVE